MKIEKDNLRGLLGEARAIFLTFRYRAITQQEAQHRTKPILILLNSRIKTLAKKYKVKPKYITFQDLGRSL